MSGDGFIPAPDAVCDSLGIAAASVYGTTWRLAQANDGGRCVAPVELIGQIAGTCGTTARRKIGACIAAGFMIRQGNGLVIAPQILDPADPVLAALIELDRENGFGRCVACGRPATQMDHNIPRSRGGSDDRSNLQAMCAGCNADKGALTMEEWGREREH